MISSAAQSPCLSIKAWVFVFSMENKNKHIDPKVLDEIIEALTKMKYGEVVITVYDSKVVQIEEKKKKRFN